MLAMSSCLRVVRLGLAAGILSLLPAAAHAGLVFGGCLEEESPEGLNCTSNDLTFILVGLGTQTDGCTDEGFGHCTDIGEPEPDPEGALCTINPDNCPAGQECRALDEVEIFLRAIIQNSTAQTRYDVGMWFASDGDPNGDGALSGECGREMLHPTRVCNGGTNDGFPCDFDSDCGGGLCQIPGHCTGAPFGRLCFSTVPDCSTTGGGTCTIPANTCPPLDLFGDDPLPAPTPPQGPASGPFVVAESDPAVFDRCGDLRAQGNSGCDEDPDGQWDDSILDFSEPVTLPCSDIDDDGFVNIATCATWGNQEEEVNLGSCESGFPDAGEPCTADNQCDGDCLPRGVCVGGANQGNVCLVDGDCPGGDCQGNSFAVETCDSEFELFNGTPAKCRCETVNSNIPVADLNLTCTLPNRCSETGDPCTQDTDCQGGMTDVCTVQSSTVPPESEILFDIDFTNPASATCDASAGCPGLPDERFQCGTASFVRFDMDDQGGSGTFINTGIPTPVEDTGGTIAVVNPELVQWNPDSECGTPNIIGPNHAGEAFVSYRVGLTVPDSITLRVRTFWSNEADLDPGLYQTLQVTCPINVAEVWASVDGVRVYEAEGRIVLEWRTTTEVATRGFNVYRLDRAGNRRIPLVAGLLSSRLAGEGSVYRVVDPQAFPGERAEYLLVEEDLNGRRRALGPYAVTVGHEQAGAALQARGISELQLGAQRREPSAGELARIETARREAALVLGSRVAQLGTGSALKASVPATGIYRIGAGELAATWGIGLGKAQSLIAGGGLRLTNRGEEVAWSPAANASALYFFGQAVDDVTTRHNVYWIEAAPGTVAQTVSGGVPQAQPGATFAESLRLESQAIPATVGARDPDTDYWFWDGVLAGDPQQGIATLDVTVPDALAGAPAELAARFYSVTDYPVPQEHTAIVEVNGAAVGQTSWENLTFHEASFSVPGGVLVAGANQIRVEGFLAPGVPVSGFFVDRFTLSYPRFYRAVDDRLAFPADGNAVVTVDGFSEAAVVVFEVTDALVPRLVTDLTVEGDGGGGFRVSFSPADPDASYFASTLGALRQPESLWADAPSDLAGSAGAEWVVVAPAQLLAAAQDLAAYREQRFSALAVDIEDVYDEFNHGLPSPLALRDFVAYAAASWPQAPQYVVLAGAGSFDYKDYGGLGTNLVPPLMVATPAGLYASDIAFGDVAGEDGVPEVAIGRIPALAASELAAYTAKLRAAERSAGPDWRGSVLVLADDPDDAGDFTAQSETVAARFPGSFAVDRAYLEGHTVAEVREQLFATLNRGVGFLNYVGHGGMTVLAEEGLLTIDDLPQLRNFKRPTVAASLSCVAGRFEVPGFESLAGAMVLAPNGGAVAMWAPSGLSWSVDAGRLNRAFVDAAFTSGSTLGSGVKQALAAYEQEGFFRHLLYVYNVFGDPAIRMR